MTSLPFAISWSNTPFMLSVAVFSVTVRFAVCCYNVSLTHFYDSLELIHKVPYGEGARLRN